MSKDSKALRTDGIARDTRAQSGVVNVVISVVVIAVVALVGVLIVSSLAGSSVAPQPALETFDPVAGQTETIDSDVTERPALLEVRATKERGVVLDGEADGSRSFVEFSNGSQVVTNGGNWTLMASGRLNESANGNASYNLLAVENETVTLEYRDGEWVATYLEAPNQTAQSRVDAPDPTTFSTLAIRHNNATDELTLIRNGNATNTTSINTESEPREIQLDWYGTVDDYRFFDAAVSDSEVNRLGANPIAGTTVTTQSRYMLDGSGSAFYSGGSVTLVGAERGAGLADPLVEGADYQVSVGPLAVTTLAGGLAEGSPILYVEYVGQLASSLSALTGGFGDAVSLIPIVLITLVAAAILTVAARIQS